MSDLVERLVLVGHRLGLGWLLGRRFVVITTGGVGAAPVLHSVARFSWDRGEIVVPITDPGAAWLAELDSKPVAMIQAAPGPLASRAERHDGSVRFRPTGQPAPLPVDSDLLWVLPSLAVLGAVLWLRR